MILLIDIGNSCLKWAAIDGTRHSASDSICYKGQSRAISDWCHTVSLEPDEIYLISVAEPTITEAVEQACLARWPIPVTHLQTQHRSVSVENGYTTADKLGVDRWAAILGAVDTIGGALLVVDCGTACTADLVTAEGLHLGGEIVPGDQLLRHALVSNTSLINMDLREADLIEWGRATTQCVDAGVVTAMCGFIERLHRRAEVQLQQKVSVVLTGGGAEKLLPHLELKVYYEPDLVFMGMMVMVAERRSNGAIA